MTYIKPVLHQFCVSISKVQNKVKHNVQKRNLFSQARRSADIISSFDPKCLNDST